MPANTAPIYINTPVIGKVNIPATVTALATSDGAGTIGTNMFLLVTGNTFGTFVGRIRIHLYGSAPTQAAATVLRFYHSTQGSGSTAATNTFLIQEVSIGGALAANATNALTPLDVPINWLLPSGTFMLVSVHAQPIANTGYQILAIAGDY